MIYSILAFIVLIGVIVFVHELGHYLAARSVGVTVEKFSIGMPPTIYNYQPKNSKTVFAIGALPLGGYVKMKGIFDESMDSGFTGADDELESKTPLQKIWVMSAGVIMNILLAFLVFVIIGTINGEPVVVNNDTTIDYVVPNSPAFEGGLNEGDMVLSVNDTNVNTWEDFTTIVKQNPNTTLSMIIVRDGSEIQKSVTPLSAPDIASGRVDKLIGKLGVDKQREIKDLSFVESFQYGFDQTIWSMVLMTTSLKMIFTGNVSKDDVGSVIMIGQMAGEAAQAGLTPFLMLMALISVNLAFINILPIPALDGGHIMVILIEMLLGKPLAMKTRMRIQSIGMYFLLALMAFLLINDLSRINWNTPSKRQVIKDIKVTMHNPKSFDLVDFEKLYQDDTYGLYYVQFSGTNTFGGTVTSSYAMYYYKKNNCASEIKGNDFLDYYSGLPKSEYKETILNRPLCRPEAWE